jgi:hypothetical protein
VVAETEFESADIYKEEPELSADRIVIGEYVVPEVSPVTVTGLDVIPVITETPFTYILDVVALEFLVNVNVNDDAVVLDTATLVGGSNAVDIDFDVDASDTVVSVIDRIVIGL